MLTVMEQYKNKVCGKTVSVIGLGTSNRPLIKQLLSLGAIVVARDKKTDALSIEEKTAFENSGVTFVLGDNYLDDIKEDIVFRTPGLKCYNENLVKAKENGSVITSEMQMFFELCPCPIFAVTGSDGKTTTTTLIYEMLTKQGFTCHKGGNIGNPLLPQLSIVNHNDIAVVELSSFQLQDMTKSPDVAVITNLSPNHLDYHKDMEEYITAKSNIFLHQTSNDRLVYNYDNAECKKLAKSVKEKSISFGKQPHGEHSVYLKDGEIRYKCMDRDMKIMSISDIKLPGAHNVENYMAACAAVIDYVDFENMVEVAKTFSGVEHRIEFVRDFKGVRYYNDSIASSPTRSTAGLKSFAEKVILIAGGYDKNLDYTDFGKLINSSVKHLVLVGAISEKIKKAVISADNYDNLPIDNFSNFKEAVLYASNIAKRDDIVLLSPASASFDMFKNFEERGNTFKNIINELK